MDRASYPVILHFEPAEYACHYHKPYDNRCQNVIMHYDAVAYSPLPREYEFKFGTLQFFVFVLRVFKFRDFFMADYKLKIPYFANSTYPYVWQYGRDDGETNRLSLLYRRRRRIDNMEIYHVTGWFGFTFEGEYYSFNFLNVEGNYTLLYQHWGPFEERQFWDRHWRNVSREVPTANSEEYDDNWQLAGPGNLQPPGRRHGPPGRRQGSTTSTNRPPRGYKLKFGESDGLFQEILKHGFHNYSTIYNYKMLQGHRDNTTVTRISVTIQFSYKFIQNQGIFYEQHYAMALLAIRTINELNGIFKRSGTLIQLYIHCIQMATIVDACCVRSRFVLESWAQPEARISADLVIAFIHELEDEYTKSYTYRLDEKVAVVLVKPNSLFEVFDIAHEIGHVLGAGHTLDHFYGPDYAPGGSPQVWYAQGYINPGSWRCTIMSANPCIVEPIFSTPRVNYLNQTWGTEQWQDNALWIRQNRFVWESVGAQDQKCKQGEGMPYIPWLIQCFTMDVTNETAAHGIYKQSGKNACHTDFSPWVG